MSGRPVRGVGGAYHPPGGGGAPIINVIDYGQDQGYYYEEQGYAGPGYEYNQTSEVTTNEQAYDPYGRSLGSRGDQQHFNSVSAPHSPAHSPTHASGGGGHRGARSQHSPALHGRLCGSTQGLQHPNSSHQSPTASLYWTARVSWRIAVQSMISINRYHTL